MPPLNFDLQISKRWDSLFGSGYSHTVHSEGDQPWDFFGKNDAKAETTVLWPPHVKSWLTGRLWCWEGLRAGGEGDDRGWDGWMASPTRWTWVSVNSGSWWWTGRPGVLQFMGLQSRTWLSDWTELNSHTEKWKNLSKALTLINFLREKAKWPRNKHLFNSHRFYPLPT